MNERSQLAEPSRDTSGGWGASVVSWDDKGKQPFVILHYHVEEAAKKGGAPVRHDYATFLDPVTKKVAFQRELKRTAAMTEPSCSYGLVARSEKGVPAVEVNSSCALRSCLETRPTPKDCAPPTTARARPASQRFCPAIRRCSH